MKFFGYKIFQKKLIVTYEISRKCLCKLFSCTNRKRIYVSNISILRFSLKLLKSTHSCIRNYIVDDVEKVLMGYSEFISKDIYENLRENVSKNERHLPTHSLKIENSKKPFVTYLRYDVNFPCRSNKELKLFC